MLEGQCHCSVRVGLQTRNKQIPEVTIHILKQTVLASSPRSTQYLWLPPALPARLRSCDFSQLSKNHSVTMAPPSTTYPTPYSRPSLPGARLHLPYPKPEPYETQPSWLLQTFGILGKSCLSCLQLLSRSAIVCQPCSACLLPYTYNKNLHTFRVAMSFYFAFHSVRSHFHEVQEKLWVLPGPGALV